MSIELLAAIFAFISVSGLVYAIFTGGPRSRALERRITALHQPAAAVSGDMEGLLKRSGTSKLPFLRGLAAGGNWADRWAIDLRRAGSNLRVSEYLLFRLLASVLIAALAFVLFSGTPFGVILGVAGIFVGYMVPAWYFGIRRGRRQQAINGQLVEMLTLIANALRSGFAFTQAIELASRQLESPIKDELDHLIRDNALGARAEDALNALAERTGSYDVEMIVTSILVQRTTGGNLSEVLDNVAETIRERGRLQGEIRALTASQRFTGLILSIYPIVLGALFAALAPSLMSVLWTEPVGRILLAIAATLQLIGIFTIRRILVLEV